MSNRLRTIFDRSRAGETMPAPLTRRFSFPPPLRYGIPAILLLFGLAISVLFQHDESVISQRNIEEQVTREAQYLGTKLSGLFAYFTENNNPIGSQREMTLSAISPELRMGLAFNGDNEVIYTTRYDLRGKPLAATSAAPYQALIDQTRRTMASQIQLAPDRKQLVGTFAFPIHVRPSGLRPAEIGVVFLDFDLSYLKAVAHADGMRRLYFTIGVLLALCVIFTLIFHKMLTARVSRLAHTADRLAHGELTARNDLVGSDELAHVAQAFDRMAEDLEARDVALRETEGRFRQVADNIREVFWLFDEKERKMLYVSPAFERISGFPMEMLLKSLTPWKSMIFSEDQHDVAPSLDAEPMREFDYEYRIERPDGSIRWVRNRSFPVKNEQGEIHRTAGVLEDITERKFTEAEHNKLERRLQETQKLESLGVLAGGIAHDFNNLLTGILGNASLARTVLPDSSEAQHNMAQIEAVSIRAADLCKQMLAYSGKGRFQVQRLNLNDLITETTQLVQLSINKNTVLRFNLADGLPSIQADATQMRQVIMNLVINGSEALSGRSGVISISTGLVQAGRDYLEKTILAPELPEGNYVFLEVSDNGTGMSTETQARIFDPFFTTKFQGRGLGLSAVLGIVRGHRGALKLYSEAGKGTTFKLLFPAAEGAAEELSPADPTSDKWTGEGTILIVDDDVTVRTVAAQMVRSFGFTPLAAVDGQEGVETYRDRQNEIVAVLMDLTMPRMDGEEAFRELRHMNPGVRVVLMSGFNEQDAINRFTGKGLAGFLQKPFKPELLRQKLREVLH